MYVCVCVYYSSVYLSTHSYLYRHEPYRTVPRIDRCVVVVAVAVWGGGGGTVRYVVGGRAGGRDVV